MKIYIVKKAFEDSCNGDVVGGYAMTGDIFKRFCF